MTVKELKDKLKMYPEDTEVRVEVIVEDNEGIEIDTSISHFFNFNYTDYLNGGQGFINLRVLYQQKEEDSNEN